MINFLTTKTPLVFFLQSFWRDEAFTYLMAKQPISSIIATTVKDFSPPLYYIILHYWMLIFGTSEIALRSLSLVCFFGVIYVVDHLLVEVLHFKRAERILTLILLGANPFLAYYAAEARMYTMAALWVSLSWYFFLTHRKRLHIVTSVLAIYTHYFTALALLAQFIVYRISHRNVGYRSFVGVGLFFLPWALFTLAFHGSSDTAFWISNPTITTMQNLPGIILTGYEYSFQSTSPWFRYFNLIGIAASLAGLWYSAVKKDAKTFSLVAWAWTAPVALLILALVKPLFLPRYVMFATIGMVVLIAQSISRLPRTALYAFFALLIFVSVQYSIDQAQDRTKANIRGVVQNLKKVMRQDDLLYVESELDFHTVQYYFDPNRVFIYRKDYRELPEYIGKVLIPESKVTSLLPQFPHRAIILHQNLTYDIQSFQ